MTNKFNATPPPYIAAGNSQKLISHFSSEKEITFALAAEGTTNPISTTGEYGIPVEGSYFATIQAKQGESSIVYEYIDSFLHSKVLIISGAVDTTTKEIKLTGFSGTPGSYTYDGEGLNLAPCITSPYTGELISVFSIPSGAVQYTSSSGTDYKLYLTVNVNKDYIDQVLELISKYGHAGPIDYNFYFDKVIGSTKAGRPTISDHLIGPVVIKREVYDSRDIIYPSFNIDAGQDLKFSLDGNDNIINFTLNNAPSLPRTLTVQTLDIINPFVPDGSSKRTMISSIDIHKFITDQFASWGVSVPNAHTFVSELNGFDDFGFSTKTKLTGQQLNEKISFKGPDGENELIIKNPIKATRASSPGLRSPLKDVNFGTGAEYFYWGQALKIRASQGLIFGMDPEFGASPKAVIHGLTIALLYRAKTGTTVSQVMDAVSHGNYKFSSNKFEDSKLGLGNSLVTTIFATTQTGGEKYPENPSYREQIYEETDNLNTGYQKSYQYITRYVGGLHEVESPPAEEPEYYWKAYDVNGAVLYADARPVIDQTGYVYFFVLITLSHLPNTLDSSTEAPNGTSIVAMPISVTGDTTYQGELITDFALNTGYKFKKYCGTGHRLIDEPYGIISYKDQRWKFGQLADYQSQDIGTIHNITSEVTTDSASEYILCMNDGTWQAETGTEVDGKIIAQLNNGYPGHTKSQRKIGNKSNALSITKVELNNRGKIGALYGNGFWNTDNGTCKVKYILSYDRAGRNGPIEVPFEYETYDYGYPIQKLKVKVVGTPGPAIWVVCTNYDTKFLKVSIPEDEFDYAWSFDSVKGKSNIYWGKRVGLAGNGLLLHDGTLKFSSVEIRDSIGNVSEFKDTFTPSINKDGDDVIWCFAPTVEDFKYNPTTGTIAVIAGSSEQTSEITYTKTTAIEPDHTEPKEIYLYPYAGPQQAGFIRCTQIIKQNKEDFHDDVSYSGFTMGRVKAHHDGFAHFNVIFDDHEVCMPYPVSITNDLGTLTENGARFHTDDYNKIRPPNAVFSDMTEAMPGELVSVVCAETPSFAENPDVLCAGLPRIGAKFSSGTVYFKTEDYESGSEFTDKQLVKLGDSRLTARVVGFNETETGRLFIEYLPGHGPLAYGPNLTVLGKPKIEKILPEQVLHDGIKVTINGKNFSFNSGLNAIDKIIIKNSNGNYIGYISIDTITPLRITGTVILETGTHLYTGPAYVVVATWTNSNSYSITIDTVKDRYGNKIFKNGNVYDIMAPDLLLPGKVHNIFGNGAITADGGSSIQNIKTPGLIYSIHDGSQTRTIGSRIYNAISADVVSSAKFPYTTYISITDSNNVAKRFPQIVHVDTKEVFRDTLGLGSSKNFSLVDGLRSTRISWPVDQIGYTRRIPLSIGSGRKVIVFVWKAESRFNNSSRKYKDYNSIPFGSKDVVVTNHGVDITISTKFQDMGWSSGDWFYLGVQVDDWTYISKHPAGVMTISPAARSTTAPFQDSNEEHAPVVIPGQPVEEEPEETPETILEAPVDNVQFVGTALIRTGEGFNYDYYIEEEFIIDNDRVNIYSSDPTFIKERYSGDHPSTIIRRTSGLAISRENEGKTQPKAINRNSESLVAGVFPLKMGPKKSQETINLYRDPVEYIPAYKNVFNIPVFCEDDGRIDFANIDHIVLTVVGEFFSDKTEFVLVDAHNPKIERFTSTRILHIEPYQVRLSDISNKNLDRKFSRAIVKFSPVRAEHYNDLANMMTIYARNPDTQVGTLNQVYVIPHNSQSLTDAQDKFFIRIADTNENNDNFAIGLVGNPSINTLFRNEFECKSQWDSVPVTNPFGRFRLRIVGSYLHGGFKPYAYIMDQDGVPIVTGNVQDSISGINVLYIDFDAAAIQSAGWYDLKIVVPYKISNDEFQTYERTFDEAIYLDERRKLPVEVINYSSGRFQDKFYQDNYFMDLPGERFGSGTKYTVSLANIGDLIENQGLDHGDIIQHIEWWLWHEDDTITTQKKLGWNYYGIPTGYNAGPTAMGSPGQLANVKWVPDEYPKIQDAINAADEGDIIIVRDGIYNENINFIGKNIWVRSQNGSANCTIDGGLTETVVAIESGENRDAILEGFRIRNGRSQARTKDGGGIRIISSSPVIRNNIIEYNQGVTAWGGSGAGIFVSEYTVGAHDNGSPHIHHNVIQHNGLVQEGGGIAIVNSHPIIEYNLIQYNSAFYGASILSLGGGISYDLINGFAHGNPSHGAIIRHNVLGENTSAAYAAGVQVYAYGKPSLASKISIDSNLFYYNKITTETSQPCEPKYGGGMLIWTALNDPTEILDLDITNNIFAGNRAYRFGGGIALVHGNSAKELTGINITNNTFYGNEVIYEGHATKFMGSGASFASWNSKINFYNNICWAGDAPGLEKEIAYKGSQGYLNKYMPEVHYCDVEGGWNHPGTGNFNQDPELDYTFHLEKTSPCIEAGLNTAPGIPEEDYDDEPRIAIRLVDVGADEYHEFSGPIVTGRTTGSEAPDSEAAPILKIPETNYGPYSVIYVKNWVTDDNLSYGIDASLSSTPAVSGSATTAIGNAWPVVEVMLEAPASFGQLPFVEFRDSVLDDGRIPLATTDNVRRGLRDVTPYRFSFGFQRDDDHDPFNTTYPKLDDEFSIHGVDRRKGAVSFRTPDCPEIIASGMVSPQESSLRGRGPDIEGIVVIGMGIRPGIEFRPDSAYISLGDRHTSGYSLSELIFRQSGAGTRAIGSFSYELDKSLNGIDVAILSSNEWTKRAIESLNPYGGDRDVNAIKESEAELGLSSVDIGESHSFGIDMGFNITGEITSASQITGISADDFLKFYGPTEDKGALSDGILYRMRVIQSTEWVEVEEGFPGAIQDPVTAKWYVKAKPRGILAFGVNIITEGKDGLPVSKFYEVASAGLIDSLPAEDWYFVGGSANTKTVLEKIDGKYEPMSVVKFRLFGAKYSNLTNDPDYFEQIFTLPTTYIEQPSIGGGQEYSTAVYNYRSVRGVMELSPSGESEPMSMTPALDFDMYGNLAKYPICATPPYSDDSHILQIPNKYWKFYIGRRPYDLIGTHIHDGIADYRNEVSGGSIWPSFLEWHSADDKLGTDPFHGFIGEVKVSIGKGSTVHDAGNIAMSRQRIEAEVTNNAMISDAEEIEEVWPSNLIQQGNLKENSLWDSSLCIPNNVAYIDTVTYDQQQLKIARPGWVNKSTGLSEYSASDAPGFDHGFYRVGAKAYVTGLITLYSPQFKMEYNNLYRFSTLVRPTKIKTLPDDTEIFITVRYSNNNKTKGKLDGLGNIYQDPDFAVWDPIDKIWISSKFLASYHINLFHFLYFYGTIPNAVNKPDTYIHSTRKFTNLHKLTDNSYLEDYMDGAAHKLIGFYGTPIRLLPAANIAFDVGVGDEYPGLDRSMMGSYNDTFHIMYVIQTNNAYVYSKYWSATGYQGGIWDIGHASIRHKTNHLAQEMKGATLLSMENESALVKDILGNNTAQSTILGSQSVVIRDNPAFMDWSV